MSKKEEWGSRGYKTYENNDITVFWNPDVYQHAGKCARGNGEVFNPKRRPWIDLSQASAVEIASIIDQCPPGTLQYELKNQVTIVFEESSRRSAAYKDGKLIGECEFFQSDSTWSIVHTGVRPGNEGQGIARRLVEKIIEKARARQVRINPLCSYAKKLMTGKEEYKDVL